MNVELPQKDKERLRKKPQKTYLKPHSSLRLLSFGAVLDCGKASTPVWRQP